MAENAKKKILFFAAALLFAAAGMGRSQAAVNTGAGTGAEIRTAEEETEASDAAESAEAEKDTEPGAGSETVESTEAENSADSGSDSGADGSAAGEDSVGAVPGRTTVCPSPRTAADTGTGALQETVDGVTFYIFDGKRYVIESDWGTHRLTGFSPEEVGSSRTASGTAGRTDYTAASTRSNLGKVILVLSENGTEESRRYDGVYKCEDTGGAPVEYGTWNTDYVPVVDLFFNTAAEAAAVSGSGWIDAKIYILKEAE